MGMGMHACRPLRTTLQPSRHLLTLTLCLGAVAEQLIIRFGVPSVTLAGRLTSRGTLQVPSTACCTGAAVSQLVGGLLYSS